MKIVIAGAGEMGNHLTRMLSGNGQSPLSTPTRKRSRVGSLADAHRRGRLDDLRGAGASAGAQVRHLFIAVNHEETDNIVAATLAKRLRGEESIARIDNNEYLEPDNKELFIDMASTTCSIPRRSRRAR